ncbi:hypothetical protein OAT16_08970 [Prolixibacteraceae bacterium]|nr:hypothetical protein [Prolixibacteraceae bacterium]
MKKIIYIMTLLLVGVSCRNTYVATTSGIAENASIILITERVNHKKYNKGEVLMQVDGETYTIDKVEKEKRAIKAKKLPVKQGKHHVVITLNGEVVIDTQVFIGRNETRKIVLR